MPIEQGERISQSRAKRGERGLWQRRAHVRANSFAKVSTVELVLPSHAYHLSLADVENLHV